MQWEESVFVFQIQVDVFVNSSRCVCKFKGMNPLVPLLRIQLRLCTFALRNSNYE
jgi:hypothetical protein